MPTLINQGDMPLQLPFGLLATTLMMLFYVFEKNTWNYGKKQVMPYFEQLKMELIRRGKRIYNLPKKNTVHPHVGGMLPDSQQYI
jgi:hypothetical protein